MEGLAWIGILRAWDLWVGAQGNAIVAAILMESVRGERGVVYIVE